MKYLDDKKLKYYNDKLFEKVIASNEIRRVEIVTEYPEVEEKNVLYLKVIE